MKLTIDKVIRKSILLWNVSVGRIPVLYVWKERHGYDFVEGTYIMIDRNTKKLEWYVYLVKDGYIYSSTIDDMTGNGTIRITKLE